jgi:hypothetical protein
MQVDHLVQGGGDSDGRDADRHVDTQGATIDYMEVSYNRQQRHSTINHETPLTFEGTTNP